MSFVCMFLCLSICVEVAGCHSNALVPFHHSWDESEDWGLTSVWTWWGVMPSKHKLVISQCETTYVFHRQALIHVGESWNINRDLYTGPLQPLYVLGLKTQFCYLDGLYLKCFFSLFGFDFSDTFWFSYIILYIQDV